MIIGGIPYYLSLLTPELSYTQNNDNLFFRKRAELWDEFLFLYNSLFPNSKNYIKIITALSQKRTGLHRDEILKMTGLPDNGQLTEMLDNLEYSGFIRINDIFGSKKKCYQLSDYYSMFYFPGVLSSSSVWSKKGDTEQEGTQIDLLIIRRDRVINVCEIKYASGEFAIDKEYDRKLRQKIEIFRNASKTKSALQLVMITTYGTSKNKYHSLVSNEVILGDLFEPIP